MIRITYEPFQEVVIKEYVRFEKIEDLIYPLAQLRASGAPVALSWANGVVFLNMVMPLDSDQLIEDYLKGKAYWTHVSFALMPEYKPTVETKEKMQVPVINVSSNAVMRQVAEWLKKQKP
jgi:hypothetical protein